MTKQEYLDLLESKMRWFVDDYKQSRSEFVEDIASILRGQINGLEIAWEEAHKLDPPTSFTEKLIDKIAAEHNAKEGK